MNSILKILLFKITFFLALALVTIVSAQSRDTVLDEILKTGTLKVGTTGDWDPMTLKDVRTNSYKGFDIDILTELARDMGVEVEFIPTDWKTLVTGLISGKYHMTGSASLNIGRMKVAGYSDAYFSVSTVPLILKKNSGRFQAWEDFNKPDVKVAATLGTTHEEQVKLFFPEARHVIVEAPARDFQEVLAGRADAHITSNIEASKLVQRFPELMIVTVEEARVPTPLAMLLPQDDQIFINFINNWIKLKSMQGFFNDLGVKYRLL